MSFFGKEYIEAAGKVNAMTGAPEPD